jgi:hypothetical protein
VCVCVCVCVCVPMDRYNYQPAGPKKEGAKQTVIARSQTLTSTLRATAPARRG